LRLLIVLAAFLAVSIAQAAPTCRIDPSLVRSWGEYHRLKELREDSYAVLYKACGRQLIFVAARHSNDPKSSAFRLVRDAFQRGPVKAAVLEGFPAAMGVSPKALVEHSSKVEGTPGDAEPYLSVRLATKAGVPLVGGEPTDREILAAVIREGMSVGDLFAFYVLRQIEQWRREQRIDGPGDVRRDPLIRGFAATFALDVGISVDTLGPVATLSGFKSWYQATNGVAFDGGYRPDDAHPSDANPRPSRQMSDKVADVRDRFIVTVIDEAMQEHGAVIVVYGGSHHLIQSPALDAAFGPPTFISD